MENKIITSGICPKCKKSFVQAISFSEPDHTGVIAVVVHTYKEVKTPFGKNKLMDEKCFLTKDEWDTLKNKKTNSSEDFA
jgi:hypothetical protein